MSQCISAFQIHLHSQLRDCDSTDMKAHSMVTGTEAITADNDAHLFKNVNLCIIQTLCRPVCFNYPWDVSRTWILNESVERHTCVYKTLEFTLHQSLKISILRALCVPGARRPRTETFGTTRSWKDRESTYIHTLWRNCKSALKHLSL